jgi:hypothetical protein
MGPQQLQHIYATIVILLFCFVRVDKTHRAMQTFLVKPNCTVAVMVPVHVVKRIRLPLICHSYSATVTLPQLLCHSYLPQLSAKQS